MGFRLAPAPFGGARSAMASSKMAHDRGDVGPARILQVVEVDVGDAPPRVPGTPAPAAAVETLSWRFAFTSAPSPTGLDAWPAGDGAAVDVWVSEQARPIAGGFERQALNRDFARAVLRHRPDAVVIAGLFGCTVDLPRIADLLGVQAFVFQDEPLAAIEREDDRAWVEDALARCAAVALPEAEAGRWLSGGRADARRLSPEAFAEALPARLVARGQRRAFDYAAYEFCSRDHPLLMRMQAPDVRHFRGCRRVLDLGCGAGIFLDLLRREGIPAEGVERAPEIADYGRGMGLAIRTADALEFIGGVEAGFDGIYCGHFVEHLPFDAVQRLIESLARALEPGGVLVLVFPDPESIRSQLLGFWRDPEHVRFYHPELIESVALACGLQCEWSSHDAQPHEVHPFAERPPALPAMPALPAAPPGAGSGQGRWTRLLRRLGIASRDEVERREAAWREWATAMNAAVAARDAAIGNLAGRTDSLWAVNATWAWNDNVTLRLRKPAE